MKILRVKAVLADKKDFLEESEMMLALDHPNLIKVCFDGDLNAHTWWRGSAVHVDLASRALDRLLASA